MKHLGRSGLFALIVSAFALPAQAAGRQPADQDWPCQQPKVASFPLASVWDGPPIDTQAAPSDDPEVADLAAQMSQRRVPIADVQAAVVKLAASPEPNAKDKIKRAFAAAFNDLVHQRSEIIHGLDRFGNKQRAMAERIRAENEAAHKAETPGLAPNDAALQKLQWDLRIYDERRQTISYVCEAPQAVEARIGALVKILRPVL
ncbi:MAG TPA: hypothetical protein VN715_20975 [Roseiarcus sp.]|nr:hypothetical protein [Roseiarcus sp.]